MTGVIQVDRTGLGAVPCEFAERLVGQLNRKLTLLPQSRGPDGSLSPRRRLFAWPVECGASGSTESMKSRETLIRLKKFQVDEKRRRVAQIETMIAEFDRMAAD